MLNDILTTIGNAVSGFIDVIADGFEAVAKIFYTPATVVEGTTVPGGFTLLGILLIIGLGIGLVYWLIRVFRGLLSNSTKA